MTAEKAIISTLAYHSIFGYPLTLKEIHRFLILKKLSVKEVKKLINRSVKRKIVLENRGLYSLPGNQKLFNTSRVRAKYSTFKKKIAIRYVKILSLIPTVKLVAITGALAMNNSKKDDDIDLLIVTAGNYLWTTRLLCNLLLFPFKRSPKSKQQKNKACLNIFLDEQDLNIREKNLYTAHELAQMKVVYSTGKTHIKLYKDNTWMLKFLPNWKPEMQIDVKETVYPRRLLPLNLSAFEKISKKIQISYMSTKKTTEKISDTQLFFHPLKNQEKVIEKYNKLINGL